MWIPLAQVVTVLLAMAGGWWNLHGDIENNRRDLDEKIENNRRESDQKWMQTNKEIIDIHKGKSEKKEENKGTNKKEEK